MWSESRDRERITAVVTVTDDGGSSGRLRRAYGILPPGDIRNCLLALSDVDPRITAIFGYRFNGQSEISDHSLGNLILTALYELEKDFCRAVEMGGEILQARGRVFPATLEEVSLVAELADGTEARGESSIAQRLQAVSRIRIEPSAPRALPDALQAVESADVITIGPGSLYTSLIPLLVIPEMARAIARSRAPVVWIMNLMTERGETDAYTARDHLLAVRRHAPEIGIEAVLLNSAPIPGEVTGRYAGEGAAPVTFDSDELTALGCRAVARDLLGDGPAARHDPDKLAEAVLELANGE
jgi:uncharacterized cofD-like protein